MSNKSGVSSQVISLPEGGGALKGIGETFSPDLFTGTGNFTVPIALPPGRNGFQPELNLIYSTGNGNGPFGLGWALSVPSVSRKTSKGVPQYRDDGAADPNERDTFILSGAEDLILVEESETESRYRPRTEGLFARIIHHRDGQDDHWEVRSKDGLVSLYGTPGEAGKDPAVVADPSNRTKVFSWSLTETRDPFGNRIVYEYERDTGTEGPHRWDQLYLKRIRYADYADENGEETFLVSVTFDYGDADGERPDPFSEHRPGFEIRTRKRCERIAIRTHADKERLVRTYELIYLDQRQDLENLEQLLPINGVSLLSQVKVIGHDGDETQELPPLEFGYTRFDPSNRRFKPFTAANNAMPVESLADEDYEMVDLFGNGLPDVVQMNGFVRFWRNLGDGAFDRPLTMPEVPAGAQLKDPGVQFGDFNGDGRADLLVQSVGGYFPLSFQGRFSKQGFVRYEHLPSFSLESPDVRLVDLDGDGVVDALRTGVEFQLFFNDPIVGWDPNRVETRARGPIEEFPDLTFSNQRVKLADMTGDGLQDFVLVDQGRIDYWPYLGHGRWGRRVTMESSPIFEDAPPLTFDPSRVLLGDVDGDGLDDVVYVEPRRITVWINQGGNRFSDPSDHPELIIDSTPLLTKVDAVRLADMLGTGTAGILWTSDQSSSSESTYKFMDLTGGTKPYVLDEMDNHMGAVTRVGYAPSTKFYLSDFKNPQTRWKTPLPFPVQVVERVEVIDELSKGKLTTEFRYHHGYWDGAEREFRGFGMVEQLDTQTFEDFNKPGLHGEDSDFDRVEELQFSPPTLTKTWFHLGPIGDEFGERTEADFSSEYSAKDAPVLEQPQETVDLLRRLPNQHRADAFRSLRGSILRTELYALDGTEREGHPYTVTESQYALRQESEPPEEDDERRRIFFPHPVAQRVTEWERGDDPMTKFSFTEDYDTCGQPQLQTQIACPRGWRALEDTPAQPYLATRSRTVYAKSTDPEIYIMNRAAKVTTYEIQNDGSHHLLDLKEIPENGSALKVIGQALNFYDGNAFEGLPLGNVGEHGALVRSMKLALTEDILHEAYKSGDTVLTPPEVPPYLLPGNAPVVTAEYPTEFLALLPQLAGYVFHPGDAEHERGYFVVTAQTQYDFQDDESAANARGLVKVTKDPLGRGTTIGYDDGFELLPTEASDPLALIIQATYDERTLKPREVTDPNGNRTRFTYTPLGLLKCTAVMGKENEHVGDTDDVPGTRFEYDFLAFKNSPPDARQPVFVRTIQRVHHVNESEVPQPERDETIETREYSDGFGRLLQTRTQAEDVTFGDPVFGGEVLPAQQTDPATQHDITGQSGDPQRPNVMVGGRQVYDNKGRVVEKYEPFFDHEFAYVSLEGDHLGQKVTMFYDPLGRVIRTVDPKGSELQVVYGIPLDLADPERFAPTPWEAYTYDENDNAGRTHPDDAAAYAHHWNTPVSIEVDALGRTVRAVERNGPDPDTDRFVTRSSYDIRGNPLTVTDALGRVAFRYVYDLVDQALRTESIDAGVRRTVPDAAGNQIEYRDGKGALTLHSYDALDRLARLWARDAANEPLTLRERIVYGDGPDSGLDQDEARGKNLLGKPHKHYDEAGLLTLDAYDFKGNLLEKTRRVIADAAILSVFDPSPPDFRVRAFRVDWQPPDGTTLGALEDDLLDATTYQRTLAYDALNRIKTMLYPKDVDGERKELRPGYNRAGALEHVELEGETFVEHIAYDAKGQRTLIALGNGVMTRYAYDQKTFRLLRLRSESYTEVGEHTYRPTGAPLQDFAYEHDLVGNILEVRDRAPGSGVPDTPLGTDALDRAFTYDSLYRLLSATGREHAIAPPDFPWTDEVKSQDVTKARRYTQTYRYDPVGNIERLRHVADGGSFTRNFSLAPASNRLDTVSIGNGTDKTFAYVHDASGNLLQENAARHFEWDYSDRMRAFRTQPESAPPSVHAHYLYDAGGQRVKKLVMKGGRVEVTVYVDGLFEHHRLVQGATMRENHTLHVMDDETRIAMVRVGDPFPDDTTPDIRYHLGDHLGSSNVVIGATGDLINREEYTPYGETSFGSFTRQRYRFTGKERDEESGLYYIGARSYAPGLARWVAADPIGLAGGPNLYAYAASNPVNITDSTGFQPDNDPIITTITTSSGETLPGDWVARSDGNGFERVDAPALLVESEHFWASGWIDWAIVAEGSEVIHIQGRTETIYGNIFSAEDGQYAMLLWGEAKPRIVSKEAYDNARYWSSYLEDLTPDQIQRAFGGVEVLERYLEKAFLIAAVATPVGRIGLEVMDAVDSAVALSRAQTPIEAAIAMANVLSPLVPGRGLGPKRGSGPVIVAHATQRAARRAAEREAGMGRHGARERVDPEPLNRLSRSPRGDPGKHTSVRSPETGRTVHHDPYGHRFPEGDTIPPHYGVDYPRGPGVPRRPTTHHTYPTTYDPRTNR